MRTGRRRARVSELLSQVGLFEQHGRRHPHELSGGRASAGIARAPYRAQFIVCDEPVSALDVSIQAQIINLLEDLQQRLGLTYLFIAHDLAVVRHISDRVVVMYLGRVMEIADRDRLYSQPLHPYTKALVSVSPSPDPPDAGTRARRTILVGETPDAAHIPTGCRFTHAQMATSECHSAAAGRSTRCTSCLHQGIANGE